MSIASCTSPPASASTFPISRLISSVSSCLSRSRSWAKRRRSVPRSGAGTSRQCVKASFAAATARSTSSAADRGNVPRTSPVAGTTDSKVRPLAASTHSPPTKFLNCRTATLATRGSLVRGASEACELGHHATVRLEPRVPGRERRVDLVCVVAAFLEPHGLRRLRRDAVLVPGDVPREGEHHLAGHARKREDRDAWLAERL